MSMVPVNFYPMTDVVILGSDPERADYDNPRGYVYGFSSYVVAVDSKGYQKRYYVSSASSYNESACLEQAEKMAQALNARLNNLGKFPVKFDDWDYFHPQYGSEAYIESGEEENVIGWERSLEENYYD